MRKQGLSDLPKAYTVTVPWPGLGEVFTSHSHLLQHFFQNSSCLGSRPSEVLLSPGWQDSMSSRSPSFSPPFLVPSLLSCLLGSTHNMCLLLSVLAQSASLLKETLHVSSSSSYHIHHYVHGSVAKSLASNPGFPTTRFATLGNYLTSLCFRFLVCQMMMENGPASQRDSKGCKMAWVTYNAYTSGWHVVRAH